MDLEALRWFTAVADGSTVTETAERFHTTQPAVTRGLQRLSFQYGAPLTEKDGRRLRLTYAGEIVAAAARRSLAEMDGAIQAVREASNPDTGTVRLGFLSQLGQELVPDLLASFRFEHPGVRFTLQQDGAERILAALTDGHLDLLLSVKPATAEVTWEPLMQEQLMLALPKTHRFANRGQIRFASLKDEPWVVLAPGYGLRQRVDELCAEAGFSPRIAFEGHDLTTLYALIAAGSGIGLFPAGRTPDAVKQLPVQPLQSRDVGLITIPGRVHPPSVDAFAAYVRAQLQPA